MSQKSARQSKRRPPGDQPSDGRQDSDWGFDSSNEDPSVEKKLGIVLVVCLLAGFGFVFYQKFRILQNAESVAVEQQSADEAGETASPTTEDPDESDSDAFASRDLASLDAEQREEVDAVSGKTIESPFFEPPGETKSTSESNESWLLTSDTAAAEPTSQNSTNHPPPGLPPLPAEGPAESFDPFAAPAVTDAENAAPDQSAITWELPESPEPPGPAEPEPMILTDAEVPPAGETDATHTPEPSPFLMDTSPEAVPQQFEPPAGVEEAAPVLVFDEREEPTATPSAPLQQDQTSVPTFAADVPAESPSDFNPFPADEPTRELVADPPSTGSVSPFPAPFPDEAAASSGRGVQSTDVSVKQPPAWPFSPSSEVGTPSPEPGSPELARESQQAMPTFDKSPPSVSGNVSSPVQPTADKLAPSPFQLDGDAPKPIPTPSVGAQSVIGEREIIVTPSDTFWSISQREYGSARYFTALARYNRDRVSVPEKLQSGIRIRIPPPEVLEIQFPELFRGTSDSADAVSPVSGLTSSSEESTTGLFLDAELQPFYCVGERDTLSSIAVSHLGRSSRWTEVYELNRDQLDSPSTLKIGMVLKLPPDASGVPVSPAGGFRR